KLTPKALAVLGLLVTRSGQVVTKAEVFKTVWADTVVSDDALTSCIQELRRALGDDARKPRFIETVHRRVCERLGKGVSGQEEAKQQAKVFSTQDLALRTQHSVLVGRETELAHLHGWLEKAFAGERQLVFVTGEPGIGKTSVVDALLENLSFGGQT